MPGFSALGGSPAGATAAGMMVQQKQQTLQTPAIGAAGGCGDVLRSLGGLIATTRAAVTADNNSTRQSASKSLPVRGGASLGRVLVRLPAISLCLPPTSPALRPVPHAPSNGIALTPSCADAVRRAPPAGLGALG